MAYIRDPDRPSLRYHAKVHTFRIFTVILAWFLVMAAFYEKPDLSTDVICSQINPPILRNTSSIRGPQGGGIVSPISSMSR